MRAVPRRRPRARGDRGEREDLKIVKLNVDENQQTAATFEVLSIPTLILFRGGQPVKKVIGAYPKKKLAELEPAPGGPAAALGPHDPDRDLQLCGPRSSAGSPPSAPS